MANKIPVKAVYTGSTVTALSEFASTDGLTLGGDLDMGSSGVGRMTSQNRFRHLNSLLQVTKSTNQSISNDTLVAVNWDVEVFDTDSIHDNVTNNTRFTAPIAGKYLVTAQVAWAASANLHRRGCAIKINNSATYYGSVIGAVENIVYVTSGSWIISLAASDYVEIFAYQDSTASLNVIGNDTASGISNASFAYLGE